MAKANLVRQPLPSEDYRIDHKLFLSNIWVILKKTDVLAKFKLKGIRSCTQNSENIFVLSNLLSYYHFCIEQY